MALKVVDVIALQNMPSDITDYRQIVGDPATGKYYKKLPGGSGGSGAVQITVDADFSIDMQLYNVLEYICFINTSPFTANIGTTSGGSEIVDVNIIDCQPVVLMYCSPVAETVFFSGMPTNTIVKYKIT